MFHEKFGNCISSGLNTNANGMMKVVAASFIAWLPVSQNPARAILAAASTDSATGGESVA